MSTRSWGKLGLVVMSLWAACSTTRPPRPGGTAGEATAPQPAAATPANAPAASPPSPPARTPPSPATALVTCSDPRPEICTQQYQPVCAQVDTGIRCIKAPCPSAESRTFPNGCAACTDPKVLGYVAGACPGARGAPGAAPEDVH